MSRTPARGGCAASLTVNLIRPERVLDAGQHEAHAEPEARALDAGAALDDATPRSVVLDPHTANDRGEDEHAPDSGPPPESGPRR
jgi:hypothetical protein